jgi:arsenite-transporting ATPase
MEKLAEKLKSRSFVFFGGKGGTGKTTCAAAFALRASRDGRKTLIASTDPAHSLSDIFGVAIGPKERPISPGLYGIEIDPEEEAKKYITRVKEQMQGVVSSVIIEEIERQIDAAYLSPGSEEAATFDKFVELMDEAGNPYDLIVFDTAPTGHTLRLLTLPEILGAWMDSLIARRSRAVKLLRMTSSGSKDDPIIKVLEKRKASFEKARAILTDRSITSFVFVINAEKLPVAETAKALSLLRKYGIAVDGIVINKVIPPEAGGLLEKRRAIQEKYLAEARTKFSDLWIAEIPLLDSDVDGIEGLLRVAAFL